MGPQVLLAHLVLLVSLEAEVTMELLVLTVTPADLASQALLVSPVHLSLGDHQARTALLETLVPQVIPALKEVMKFINKSINNMYKKGNDTNMYYLKL